jgi:DNA topoisomerase IB
MRVLFISLARETNWFEKLSPKEQEEYIEKHPGSKYAKMHKTKTALSKATTINEQGVRVNVDGSSLPKHIQKLRIPPAWKDVKYNPDPNGSLLASGKDAKGRQQFSLF